MKVSETWLREWVNPEIDAAEIGSQLTMAGVELDGIEPVAADFSNVVVAEILSAEKHPGADKLRICQVNCGQDEPVQIVCGAPNARAGLKAPLAMIGAVLGASDGSSFKIKKSKLRGELSFGMLCSASELGLAESADGLLEIAADAPVGQDIREYMMLNDVILELDATPNRADCLSIAGIAREVGVLTQTQVTAPEIATVEVVSDEQFGIEIQATDDCQRYAGRIIRNVNVKAETPLWMVERLRRADIRSLGPVVDVTNYVMIEQGQPMHGFDFDKLSGGIVVRKAAEGEPLTLLDGREVALNENTLVIADQEKAVALAGIMGGLDTSVTDDTQNIFLESAYFVPEKIMGKSRNYGLHTDSSHRFERGVSPDLQAKALERATQLILEICGGEVAAVNDVVSNPALLDRSAIILQSSDIVRHLGITVDAERVTDILQRLGCEVEVASESWSVTPPVFRFDISREVDLIEEVARVYGYDKIPSRLRPMEPRIARKLETEVNEDILRQLLVAKGYREAVTYSFVPSEIELMLNPAQEQIRLANPISEELAIMRSTLWSGLIPALVKNLNRQQSRVRLFEMGLNFVKTDSGIKQRKQLAGVITGTRNTEHWDTKAENVDFFDIKGDVEKLLAEATETTFHFAAVAHPALHPGQSAQIIDGDNVVGWVGALHPRLEKSLGLSQTVFLFELDMDRVSKKSLSAYKKLSRFPSIRRDLALIVDQSVTASAISRVLENAGVEALTSHSVFDVYEGPGVEAGQKSLALGLIFQDFSRTLEDADINAHVDSIVQLLEKQTGGVLRQ
ncbi:phenylalanine--tRNA ligase subunit beta [Leucothrix pacifica]|uniref:Phenylalanine--tRNA ligase beta subunit n=1 Tax=Leucothrix pacifica TaxID=1247513 RepID=A0A317CQX2_9GAMM|nr:phenylalanine--tRNA ligase subunit beta [Leucothrix pacifica]PWR00502.1 phenylalanine--tRNA ligase subunit beta [Leucothrix pacifica]